MTRPKPADTNSEPVAVDNTRSHDTVIVYDCDKYALGRYESNVPLTDEEVRRIGAAIRRAYEAPRLKERLNVIDNQISSLLLRKAEVNKMLGEADGRRDTPHKPHRETEKK
jgi:hypothetical protein